MTNDATLDLGQGRALQGRALQLVTVVGGKLRRYDVENGTSLVLGRADDADIVIDSPNLSRLHARILLEDPLRVCDLGSRNGTRIDGERLRGTNWEAFRVGQPIELADALVLIQDRSATGSINELAPAHGADQPTKPHETFNTLAAPSTLALYETAERVAQAGLPILITGESGSGKEHLARFIHERSPQSRGRLIAVDCAALSPEHFLDELFGRANARNLMPGLLRAAHDGTLLLDSVDLLPREVQTQLSRVIETGCYVPSGAAREERSSFRIMATSRVDLASETARGSFQTELFYRICGVHLLVPPLRACRPGILGLIEDTLAKAEKQDQARIGLDERALQPLMEHDWPGNIRELKLTLRRLVALFPNQQLSNEQVHAMLASHVPQGDAKQARRTESRNTPDLTADLEKLERQRIVSALNAHNGNQTKTAEALGISRKVLMRRLDQYSIPRPRKGAKNFS